MALLQHLLHVLLSVERREEPGQRRDSLGGTAASAASLLLLQVQREVSLPGPPGLGLDVAVCSTLYVLPTLVIDGVLKRT